MLFSSSVPQYFINIALHAVYLKALVTYYQTFRIIILIFASPPVIKTRVYACMTNIMVSYGSLPTFDNPDYAPDYVSIIHFLSF